MSKNWRNNPDLEIANQGDRISWRIHVKFLNDGTLKETEFTQKDNSKKKSPVVIFKVEDLFEEKGNIYTYNVYAKSLIKLLEEIPSLKGKKLEIIRSGSGINTKYTVNELTK